MNPTVSLTFDDGMICQRDIALPLLRRYHLPATFFLPGRESKIAEWRDTDLTGMEVGSHSVSHGHGLRQSIEVLDHEARTSQIALESGFARGVFSFAYPYAEYSPEYERALKWRYVCARGGHRAQDNKYLRHARDFNRYNVPCFQINNISVERIPEMLDRAIRERAWLVLMFHAVSPDPAAFDCILPPRFEAMCQEVRTRQRMRRSLDVKTFSDGYRSITDARD